MLKPTFRRTLSVSTEDVTFLRELGKKSKTKGLQTLLEKIPLKDEEDFFKKQDTYAAFFITDDEFMKLRQLGDGNASDGLRCLLYKHRKCL